MTRRSVLPALPVLPSLPALLAQTATPPDTPAGFVLKKWLAAINAGTKEAIAAYAKIHEPQGEAGRVDMLVGLAQKFGGFDLVSIESSKRTEVIGVLQPRKDARKMRFYLAVEDSDPPVVAGANLSPADPQPSGPKPERTSFEGALKSVEEFAAAEAAADRFSGALLVAMDGAVRFEKAWGYADREAKTPNTPATKFRIGSMNKMFTAVATLQLVEKGKLSLADPLIKHMPGYPNKDLAGKVTVRHLLTHTGGTGDIFGPEFEQHRMELRTLSDYVKLYGERKLQYQPGERWAYSNYGFLLLGALIEKVSGVDYYAYVRNNVFAPAGMHSTDSPPESEAAPGRSKGYLRKDNAWVDNRDTLPWRGTSAGGGYSTVGDLFRFALALHSGKLLNRELVNQAIAKQEGLPRPGLGYGFGFMRDDRAPVFVGHGGGAPGMNGELRIYIGNGVVVSALSNFDPPAATNLAGYFADRMPV